MAKDQDIKELERRFNPETSLYFNYGDATRRRAMISRGLSQLWPKARKKHNLIEITKQKTLVTKPKIKEKEYKKKVKRTVGAVKKHDRLLDVEYGKETPFFVDHYDEVLYLRLERELGLRPSDLVGENDFVIEKPLERDVNVKYYEVRKLKGKKKKTSCMTKLKFEGGAGGTGTCADVYCRRFLDPEGRDRDTARGGLVRLSQWLRTAHEGDPCNKMSYEKKSATGHRGGLVTLSQMLRKRTTIFLDDEESDDEESDEEEGSHDVKKKERNKAKSVLTKRSNIQKHKEGEDDLTKEKKSITGFRGGLVTLSQMLRKRRNNCLCENVVQKGLSDQSDNETISEEDTEKRGLRTRSNLFTEAESEVKEDIEDEKEEKTINKIKHPKKSLIGFRGGLVALSQMLRNAYNTGDDPKNETVSSKDNSDSDDSDSTPESRRSFTDNSDISV